MFNKKSKKIKSLEKQINIVNINARNSKKENIEDIILILDRLREINNEKSQWKHRQLEMNNMIDLTKERFIQKIVELDIDAQY